MSNNKLKITQKPLKGEDGHKYITVRIESEALGEINKIVAKSRRSRNDIIGKLINYSLQHCEIEFDDITN